ncbi:MMPL family transporter, partial [Actinoplanes sp. NPDC051861]|uniref:MMPL family transporter n=1 Tax=Actinoplanes sp. NPDC051861 TaxID=3155170 RepID=UPI0034495193
MIGRFVLRRARWILAFAALLTVVAGVLAAGVLDRLALNRFEAPGAESMRAREALAEHFGTGSPNLALLVTARSGTVDSPAVAAAGQALTAELAGSAAADAWSYWSTGRLATMRSQDGRQALVLAWLPGDANTVRREVLPSLTPAFTRTTDVITVQVGGGDEVFRTVMQQARADFLRAELIVIPLVFLLLWWVFRRASAAAITLGTGIFAVLGSLALLRVVVEFVEISTFASNIALVMGIGLGVDYGLFVIFRFREELQSGAMVRDAVLTTVRSAGRTVLFSAATVALSLAVLLLFPFPFLASFAYAGIAVVLAAAIAATLLLPAALALLGHRALPRRRAVSSSFWYAQTTRVMRRPILFGGAALAVLLLLGAPLLGIRFGLPDDRVLPSSAPVRQMYDQIRAGFAQEEADALQIVTYGTTGIAPYAAELSRLPGIVRVDSAAGSFAAGSPVPGPPSAALTAAGVSRLSVVPSSAALAEDAVGLVEAVRDVPAPVPADVGGYPADLADYRAGVLDRLPLIAAAIVLVTFLVLFVMTGSVVAPLKAVVLNALSLTVMFGALVFVFQDGNLSGLLGFTPTGSIEPSIPILMFCVAWGLSMDYEVFLLSRIKEEYDRTGDAYAAVPLGISRSGPLVTAAALILAVSFATYATGRVVFLQQLGIGMALAVLIDATVVRGVLMPAFLRLAGPWNWWSPPPLRHFHTQRVE